MKAYLANLMEQANQLIAKGICPMCHKPVGNFKDALSLKEYRISGMCQTCQDEVFDETI